MPKHGDIIFIYNKFKWNDVGTWLAPFIRAALNKENKITGKGPIKMNHCAFICEINGTLYVYQAALNTANKKVETFRITFEDWSKDKHPNNYFIKTPDFYFDKDIYQIRLDEAIGKPYDFFKVIVLQPVRLVTLKTLWLGNWKTNKFYCSNLGAYAYQNSRWDEIDPENLFELKWK